MVQPFIGGVRCNGIPRVTIYSTDTPGVEVGDYYLRERKQAARRTETWGGDHLIESRRELFSGTFADDDLEVLWNASNSVTSESGLILSPLDADLHVLTRHAFKAVRMEPDSGPDALIFDMVIAAGGNSDEFVITFSGWCTALPLTITASNTEPVVDPPDNPEILTQTGTHEWTITRATNAVGNVTTLFTISGINVSIQSTDSLATLQDRFAFAAAVNHSIGTETEPLRRDVYGFERTFGTDTSIDPSKLFVLLDMTERRPEPLHYTPTAPHRLNCQIEYLNTSGLYDNSNLGRETTHFGVREQVHSPHWRWSGVRMGDRHHTDPTGFKVDADVYVRLTNGEWTLETHRREGGRRIVDLWLPITDTPVGDRPGEFVVEWAHAIHPFYHPNEADGSRPDGDVAALSPEWNLTGCQIRVSLLNRDESSVDGIFVSGGTVPRGGMIPNRSLHIVGTGFSDSDLNVDSNLPSVFGTFHREDDALDLPSWQLSADGEGGARFSLTAWSGAWGQADASPEIIRHHWRRLELVVLHDSNVFVFVPTDGRLYIDKFYDDVIAWQYDRTTAGSGSPVGTFTTQLTHTTPGDCPDYEDFGHFSPLVFEVTYRNDTYLLPRTGHTEWSRIIEVDGVRLAFCLEHHVGVEVTETYRIPDVGWTLTIYAADDIALPWRQVYRFQNAGPEQAAELDEVDAFNDWKPFTANTLCLLWHREDDDILPESVSVAALPVSHPAGSSEWTWSASSREWSLTADSSDPDYVAFEPPTRAAVDGATLSTVSRNPDSANWVTEWAGWWSPDGVEWVLIVDGCGGGHIERPDAPTHIPRFAGESYLALCVPA